MLNREIDPDQIDTQNVHPVLRGQFEEITEPAADPGIGIQRVQRAELADSLVHGRRDIGFA